jgi:serine/threonine-protein kinase RsbW
MSDKLSREWHVNSEPVLVRDLINEIQNQINEALPGQSLEERGDIRLILNELIYNAVIHGNGSDTNKQIHIQLSAVGSKINAKITDEGNGYDYNRYNGGRSTEDELLSETGRGMTLVHALTDSLTFDKSGRCVTFVKTVVGLTPVCAGPRPR